MSNRDNRRGSALAHHDLCFGCGRANLFGLLFDGVRDPSGVVAGQWFVKQDHQGPVRGCAHPGLIGAALLEAMMLAAGESVVPVRLQCELTPDRAAPVGSFCEITASMREGDDLTLTTEAVAAVSGEPIARAQAEFAREP